MYIPIPTIKWKEIFRVANWILNEIFKCSGAGTIQLVCYIYTEFSAIVNGVHSSYNFVTTRDSEGNFKYGDSNDSSYR